MARFLIRATTDHRPVDDKADDNDKHKESEVAVVRCVFLLIMTMMMTMFFYFGVC